MKNRIPSFFKVIYVLIVFWLILKMVSLVRIGTESQTIPYSEFLNDLDQKRIEKVQIRDNAIQGSFKGTAKGHSHQFLTYKINDPNLINHLRAAGVQFSALPENRFWTTFFAWMIPLLFFFSFLLLLGRFGSPARGGGLVSLGKSKARIYMEKTLHTKFDDVAGVDEAKEELKEIVNFLRNPPLYSRLGGRMPKGILLVGPPGTGKTLLARAVAGEAGVPFFSINGSEFVELFVGLGAARVRDLFEQARSHAPCIIFIDELDALGKARGLNAITGSANDEKEQTLNQLLAELDGFDTSKGVILLAATNRPEILDPALLRAGRFDRQVLVDKPGRIGREKIIQVHLKNVKLSKEVKIEVIASLTAGFSGADLANLDNEAALIATRRGAESVEMPDFTQAIERIVAGLERKTRLLNEEEKRRVAHHEMGHAVLALAMGHSETVHKVSIIPRGIGALGYTFRRPTEDRYLMSRSELEAKMVIALGGKAAESMFFEDTSTGAADDLDKATEIARAMVTRYGMSDKVGFATFEKEPSPILGSQLPVRSHDYSEGTARLIDEEVAHLLKQAYVVAVRTLGQYRHLVEESVQILLVQETLEEPQLQTLWKKYHQVSQIHLQEKVV